MLLIRSRFTLFLGYMKVLCERGLSGGFLELGCRISKFFYRHGDYHILAYALGDEDFKPDARADLVIRPIDHRENIAMLSPLADSVDMARFYMMFEHGSICFCAFQNDQIVGYGWASREIDRAANRVQSQLGPGDACLHDLFVSPKHRGCRIGEALVAHRLRFLQEHGFKRGIWAVSKGNYPALSMNNRLGCMYIGDMSHTRILLWDSFRYHLSPPNKNFSLCVFCDSVGQPTPFVLP
jgi:GNAT superfamily N-acetyltransferase